MKKIILKSILFTSLVFLFSVIVVSCTKDEYNAESNNMDKLISELKVVAKKENKIKHFYVYQENEIYKATELNEDEVFAFEFDKGFTKNNNETMDGTRGVKVSCSTGGSTFCPDGSGQGSCVGSAVSNCLNGNGTATVKKAVVSIEP